MIHIENRIYTGNIPQQRTKCEILNSQMLC